MISADLLVGVRGHFGFCNEHKTANQTRQLYHSTKKDEAPGRDRISTYKIMNYADI